MTSTRDQMLSIIERHCQCDRLAEAEALCRQFLEQFPVPAEMLNQLGMTFYQNGAVEMASELIRKAIASDPIELDYICNLAGVLLEQGDYAQAISCFDQVLAVRSQAGQLHQARGVALELAGRTTEAVQEFRRAIELNFTTAHQCLATVLLSIGDWQQGWREWEFDHDFWDPWRFVQPQWDGAPIPGKTLLLYASRNMGDTLNFIRFLPALRRQAGSGARIVVHCQAPLKPLLADSFPETEFVSRVSDWPPFDLRLRTESLPNVLGITLEKLEDTVPYLKATEARIAQWRDRVPRDGKINVGLVWAGSSRTHRSWQLEIFAPLANLPDIRFFNLQTGPESSQKPPAGMSLIDYTPELTDFAQTAAFVNCLDLVICVDTSVGHLAGAMKKPVWVLIPHRSDFRWLLNRNDTPWYPTMRLFRQQKRGDWQTPVREMAEALLEARSSNFRRE
jgi:tetratricopeptide (TPR) repeat protein